MLPGRDRNSLLLTSWSGRDKGNRVKPLPPFPPKAETAGRKGTGVPATPKSPPRPIPLARPTTTALPSGQPQEGSVLCCSQEDSGSFPLSGFQLGARPGLASAFLPLTLRGQQTHQLAKAAEGANVLRQGGQLVVAGDEDLEGQVAEAGGQG